MRSWCSDRVLSCRFMISALCRGDLRATHSQMFDSVAVATHGMYMELFEGMSHLSRLY